MVKPSVFDRSEVSYYNQTDLKASLEIRRPQLISVKITENIKESADSKHPANILYQITFLVFSLKPLRAKN